MKTINLQDMKSLLFKYIYEFIFSTCCVLLIQSCSDDYTTVRIEDELILADTISIDETFYPLNISAKINSFMPANVSGGFNITGNIPANAIIHVYVYKAGKEADENKCYAKGVYYSRKTGKIVPIHDNVQLQDGIYDIYMLSVFNSDFDKVPDFNPLTGKSKYVYNGTDYVWGKRNNVNINAKNNETIEFVLNHCATHYEVEFSGEQGYEIGNISSVRMTAAKEESGSWSVATGIINPATSVEKEIDMDINNMVAECIMLPVEIYNDLTLSFLEETNETTKSYSLYIPCPRGKIFQGGYTYNYKVKIGSEKAIIE